MLSEGCSVILPISRMYLATLLGDDKVKVTFGLITVSENDRFAHKAYNIISVRMLLFLYTAFSNINTQYKNVKLWHKCICSFI
jgi:hypothetical protein